MWDTGTQMQRNLQPTRLGHQYAPTLGLLGSTLHNQDATRGIGWSGVLLSSENLGLWGKTVGGTLGVSRKAFKHPWHRDPLLHLAPDNRCFVLHL